MSSDILLVKIHRAIDEGKDYYQATRGHWKLDQRRLNDIQYVVGISRGNVVSAYVPTEWYVVEEGPDAGRKGFVGHEVSDAFLSRLIEASERLLNKFGQGSSIAYASSTDDLS